MGGPEFREGARDVLAEHLLEGLSLLGLELVESDFRHEDGDVDLPAFPLHVEPRPSPKPEPLIDGDGVTRHLSDPLFPPKRQLQGPGGPDVDIFPEPLLTALEEAQDLGDILRDHPDGGGARQRLQIEEVEDQREAGLTTNLPDFVTRDDSSHYVETPLCSS